MRVKFFWLLPLLILVLRPDNFGVNCFNYDRQVIVVLENDQTTLEAAYYLFGKHKSTSSIVEWKNGMFEHVDVKINEERKFESLSASSDVPQINDQDWKRSRIQVIGHGIINSESVTIGGRNADELAEILSKDLSHGNNIGRISIIGCTRFQPGAQDSATPDTPPFLKDFMERLKTLGLTETTVSMRSALVSVDQNGRKLIGKRYNLKGDIKQNPEVGVLWKHKDKANLWLGEFENGKVKYTRKNVAEGSTEILPPKYFGVLPKDSPVYVTKPEKTYEVSDKDALTWIDETVAQQTYDNILKKGRLDQVDATMVKLTGELIEEDPVKIKIKEISSVQDLLKEVVYHGETGPVPGGAVEYYRFGDWVVSLDPKEFYVKVEGVIKQSSSEEDENKVKRVREKWKNYIAAESAQTEHQLKEEEKNRQGEKKTIKEFQLELRNNQLKESILPQDYSHMRLHIGTNFFDEITSWLNGEHDSIGLEIESAYNAQCGIALFMSESIRSFQTHITNMMGLDLAQHGYLTKEYFIDTHPMARGKTWQMKERGTKIRKTGLEMLRHQNLNREERTQYKKVFETTKSLVSRITKSWLSHVSHKNLEGSGNLPTPDSLYTGDDAINHLYESLVPLVKVGIDQPQSKTYHQPQSKTYLRDYDLTSPLLSTKITGPEMEAVETQIREFSSTELISSPLRASIALANDHAYISNSIAERVAQKGKNYKVVPDSISVEGEGAVLKFQIQDSNQAGAPEEISATIDTSKLESKTLMDQLEDHSTFSQNTQGKFSRINQGLAIFGVIRGLAGAIDATENGNITQGAVGLTQSLHGIGELSGINRAIYKASGQYLGRLLRNQVDQIGERAVAIAGEDTGRLLKAVGGEVLSTVGEVGELLDDVPIVGTAFGIYNIYEDFQQHSVLGYIDAGLDIAITGLALLGPEALPVVVALTVIRMGIDIFYNDISKELKALPPDASVGQKIGAFFKGIGQSFKDIFEEFTLPGQIIGAIQNSHKLDKQNEKDRSFLSQLSDYHNYFTVVKEEGSGAQEINFAGGSESWNGGDITFHLGMSGQSTLSLEYVDSDGNTRHSNHTVDTTGVEDIVMGIGESHSISFKKQTAKFLWFIPVHSQNLISQITGEKQTLHGSYFGNSRNNKFIAVQKLPDPSLEYNLLVYHYKLYGMEGDDSFYLGPQQAYVEGNDGSDIYFIDDSSVFTEINNYADDGMIDYMIFNLSYSRLQAQRVNFHLRITTPENTHAVLIFNWFLDDTYQHMIFKTSDGVLFKVSATVYTGRVMFVPYALSGAAATRPVVFDANEHEMSQVVTLTGSDFDDEIKGNKMDNQINGGKGYDQLYGGEGKDTYTINVLEGVDTIDNYATDGKTDYLIFGAPHSEIETFTVSNFNNVYLARAEFTGNQTSGAIIKDWFAGVNHRHLLLVSEDGVVLNISSTKSERVKLQPVMVDMSLIQTSEQERQIDLSNDPLLTEVITVIGSDQNDQMIGNNKNNYMSSGKGRDFMEGKGGQDVYVVMEGDGTASINNYARDNSMDTILFEANFDDILLSSSQNDLILTSQASLPAKKIEIIVGNFFVESTFQHLVVRSADGIVFDLPSSKHSLVKTARVVDNSKLTTNTHLTLTGKWSHVERVLGSKGNDRIFGNSLSNYMDPRVGRCYLEGKNGSDTYIIKDYGKGNKINNTALDSHPDTIVFAVPFFSITSKVQEADIQLTSITSRGHTNVRLMNYLTDSKSRHLTVVTEDGYTFVIPTSSYTTPVPIIINRAWKTTGQHINLTANATFSEVRTVYGSKGYQNHIIGNEQNNTIVGGNQDDAIQGLGGDDVIKGGAGNDNLQGGRGGDTLVGGDGNDRLDGGDGDDVISPGLGTNVVDGGNGVDTVIYGGDISTERGVHIDLHRGMCIHHDDTEDSLSNIENAYGTKFDDMLTGNQEDNVLVGQSGDDYLAPGSGYDILNGGNGSDTYDLSDANGTVIIQNYAIDQAFDKVIMLYTNMAGLRYQMAGKDFVVRVINSQYSVFNDQSKPTVIFKRWFEGAPYHHAYIETADGPIEYKVLKYHATKLIEG